MDLTKILKKGDKVYCVIYGYVNVTTVNTTSIVVSNGYSGVVVNCNGKYDNNGECLIFPSKENRDWNTISKFKNGDVIISKCGNIAIFSHIGTIGNRNDVVFYHCLLSKKGSLKVKTDCGIGCVDDCSLASDQQKDKIFKALKANSYKWNDETGVIEELVSFTPFEKC